MSYRMIPKVKELKLIAIYLHISDIYKNELMYSCQRFSNDSEPEFAGPEVMTIYLYVMNTEQRFKIKQIDGLKVWQPIESLFNWLIEKTDIQRASKVRSTKGLMVYVFGRIAAAYIFLILNS